MDLVYKAHFKIQEEKMKHLTRALSILLAVTFIVSCMSLTANANPALGDEAYKQSLRNKGFPETYVTRLADLHVQHPQWIFEPLMITNINSSFTWDYVIYNEIWGPSGGEDNNLIDKDSDYSAYWLNTTGSYDSGKRPVSEATLKFFMDPRNFMNEKRIFMFKDLNYNASTNACSVESVNRVFSGTFMHNAVVPGSDNPQRLTYAQVVYNTSVAVGIDPMFIASRLRQEKGVDGNTKPLLNGACGETLYTYYKDRSEGAPSSGYSYSSLSQYNNLYNYFNINASGNGYFNIYLNAMKEAQSEGWNTHMKALTGGIPKVKQKYIDQYQNTLYLQKFNVDPRSGRMFWGQYMQTVYAVYSEAYSTYQGYLEYDIVDNAFTFSIPVFSGMPDTPQKDPGTKFTDTSGFLSNIEMPAGGTPQGGVTRNSLTFNFADSTVFSVGGWSVHTTSRSAYEFSVDGGNWVKAQAGLRPDVQNAISGYTHGSMNSFNASVDMTPYGLGTHVVRVRGKLTDGGTYPIASFTLNCIAEGGEIEINAGAYKLGNTASGKTMTNINAGESVSSLLSKLNDECRIVDENGFEVSSGVLKTGYKVQYYKYSMVFDEAIIIVKADTTGDGIVNGKDLIRAKKIAAAETNGYIEAADFDGTNSISQSDLSALTALIGK